MSHVSVLLTLIVYRFNYDEMNLYEGVVMLALSYLAHSSSYS